MICADTDYGMCTQTYTYEYVYIYTGTHKQHMHTNICMYRNIEEHVQACIGTDVFMGKHSVEVCSGKGTLVYVHIDHLVHVSWLNDD